MAKQPTVTIIGCGYVGLTTAAVLANCGVQVRAIETNPQRLSTIQKGHAFFYELGINELLANALKQNALVVTDSYEQAVPDSSIVFSCVGTPDNPDGSSNLEYVHEAAAQAAEYMKPGTIFAQKSTVPVGTGKDLESKLKGIAYVSNPEFLREGTAISDTLWSDRVVAGSDDPAAAQTVLDLYKTVESCRENICKLAGIEAPTQPAQTTYVQTNLNSAELIKVTANAFLALKISFANSIAKLADHAGADVVDVMDAVGADHRIGRAFLNAGRGYGGGCFPKDVSGLIRSAEDFGVDMEIMKAATEVNDSMPHYIIRKAQEAIGGSFKGKYLAVLGLAFKAGTSDARRSPAITIANTLAELGANVHVYDPEAIEEAKEHLVPGIKRFTTIGEAIKDAEAIFIATDWPEFKDYDWNSLQNVLIVDCMNCLPKSNALTGKYIGVGLIGYL